MIRFGFRSLTIDQKAVWLLFLLGTLAGWAALATTRWLGGWAEIYFPLLFSAVFGALSFFAARAPEGGRPARENRAGRTTTILFFSVFALMLAYRLYYAHAWAPSLWADEDIQLTSAAAAPPVHAGILAVQPPLDYALQHCVMGILGISEISVRLGAIIFSSLATALLCVFCLTVTQNAIVALAIGAIYSFHAIIGNFGFEARPYSAALVAAMLVLWAGWRFLAGGERSARAWVYGCAAGLLCLFFIGQQPAFLLLSLSLVTAFFPGIPWRSKFWIISQWVVAVLLFLPIQADIVLVNGAYLRHDHAGAAELLRHLRREDFLEVWRNFGAPILFSLFVACVVLPARLWSGKASKSLRLSFFFTVVALIVPLTLIPSYRLYASWYLSVRYTIFVWLIGCVALVFACKSLIEVFGRVRALAWVVIGMGLWSAARPRLDRELRFEGYGHYAWSDTRPDYRSALAWIRSRYGKSGALVVSGCVGPASENCWRWLTGNMVYLKELRIPEGGKFDFQDFFDFGGKDWISRRLFSEIAPGKRGLLLLMDELSSPEPLPPLPPALSRIEHRRYAGIDLYVIPDREAREEQIATLLRLAEYLDGVAESQEKSVDLLPLLVYGYHALGNREMTRKYMRIAEERGLTQNPFWKGVFDGARVFQ